MADRIMYIESKASGLTGEARIGRVTFSKSGRSLYYDGRTFKRLVGGYKANYYDADSLEKFWISGPKQRGGDRLYGERVPVYVDPDVREEYWTQIRKLPNRAQDADA